jgi:hypothetical protein
MTVDQLKNSGIFIGSSLTFPKRSVTVILTYVPSNERLLAVACATFGAYGNGAIAITNKRFIYAKHKLLGRSIFLECDVNMIDSVEYSNNVLRIDIHDQELIFQHIAPEAGAPFIMHLPVTHTAMSGFDIMLASIDKRKLLGA